MGTYLDDVKGKVISVNGVQFPDRKNLKFNGPAFSGADDPTGDATLIGTSVGDAGDLRDVVGTSGAVYITNGAATAGDGGGGTWVYVDGAAPATYVDNTGTIIVPTGGDGSGAWLRQYDGYIDARWFGLSGTNDTTPIQNAINAASATLVGQTVIFHQLSPVAQLELKSNVRLLGVSRESTGLIGVAGYDQVLIAKSADAVSGASLENLLVRGTGSSQGLSVFDHNVRLEDCDDILIKDCLIDDIRGDGIIILGGSNYTIRDSVIDGVTNDNRNGISIISGNEILIDNCHFTRLSEATKPGAIDIEPDAATETCSNITVSNCYFENVTGAFGCVQLGLGAAQADYAANNGPAVNFRFVGNQFGAGITNPYLFRIIQTQTADETVIPNNIVVEGNQSVGGSSGAYLVNGVSGVVFSDNQWRDQDGDVRIGDLNPVFNISIEESELFHECMGTNGTGVQVGDVDRAQLWPQMVNCGKSDNSLGFGLNFIGGGASDNIDISRFRSVDGARSTVAVNVNGSHTQTDPRNNMKRGIQTNGFRDANSFQAHKRDERYVNAGAFAQAVADSDSLTSDYVDLPTNGLLFHFRWRIRVISGTTSYAAEVAQSFTYDAGSNLTAIGGSTGSLPAGVSVSYSFPATGTVRLSLDNASGLPIYNVGIETVAFTWDDIQAEDPIFKHAPSYVFDADDATESGGNVTDIDDAALRGNDISEGTAANQFAYISSWRNGHAACQGASGDRMRLTAFAQGVIAQPFTRVIVGEWSQDVAGEIWSDSDAGAAQFKRQAAGVVRITAGTALNTAAEPSDGTPFIAVCVFNGASSRLTIYPDGESVIVATGNAGAGSMTGVVLGAVAGGGGNYLRGKLAFEGMVPKALSSTEETELVNFNKIKYSITPS